MSSHVITCPFCGRHYKLTTENPSALAGKQFRCKSCNHLISFSQVLHLEEPAMGSPVSTQDSQMEQRLQGSETHMVASPLKGKIVLEILSTGDRIALAEGQYTIGRRSSDSKANVQIAPDPYMSRLHARLAAKLVGGRFIAQVCTIKDSNPVFLNGKACNAGQPYTLHTGDRLKMGETHVSVTIA